MENQPETIQNYAHPYDHALLTYEMTRGFKHFTGELRSDDGDGDGDGNENVKKQ